MAKKSKANKEIFDMRFTDPETGEITTLQSGDLFLFNHISVSVLRKNDEGRWNRLVMWTLNGLNPELAKLLSKTVAALVGAAQGLGIEESETPGGHIFVELDQ